MVVVIGGGPAGIMAAISASSSGEEAALIEKNTSLGRKLLLTGGGRCNLTNNCPQDSFLQHYSRTGAFLRDAFKRFGREDLVSFFAGRGLEIKREEDGRMFPVTDRASSVIDILEKELKAREVRVLRGKSVSSVNAASGRVSWVEFPDGKRMEAEKVIIATGGISYSSTGSTGDGFRWAEELGHKVMPLKPGLVSLNVEQDHPLALEGLCLEGVNIDFRSGKKKIKTGIGSLLFTKTGITGPLVLSASDRVIDLLDRGDVCVEIDILPHEDLKGAESILTRKFKDRPSKNVKAILKEMVPGRFAGLVCGMIGLDPDKRSNQVTEKERKRLRDILKSFRLDISREISTEKAQVTRGGVSVKDVDPRTMQSRVIQGLYFAGEVIDVDGECGGFNLQAAFSTGYLAGDACNRTSLDPSPDNKS